MAEDKMVVLGEVERRLAAVKTVDEAKSIRDQAEAVRVYVKSARMGLEIQNHAAFVKIRAEQRAGELLAIRPKLNGARDGKTGLRDATPLSAMGVEKTQSHRWQAMATVPENEVRRIVAERTQSGETLTSGEIFRMARSAIIPEAPPPIETPGFPTGPFRAVVIDPPWPVEKIVFDSRPVERERMDYATWTLERIRDELPVARLADARGAHVYLWTTHHFLPFALSCFEAWNVRYECVLTWAKPTAMPLWWMFNAEHCLFGKVASLAPIQKGHPVMFQARQQRHSHKPEEFYELVRFVSPGPRLTMFDCARDGFEYWGVQHADPAIAASD